MSVLKKESKQKEIKNEKELIAIDLTVDGDKPVIGVRGVRGSDSSFCGVVESVIDFEFDDGVSFCFSSFDSSTESLCFLPVFLSNDAEFFGVPLRIAFLTSL